MSDQHTSGPEVRYELSGGAETAIQAGSVAGGVHVTVGGGENWTVPRQLPQDVSKFVNRESELAQLDSLLSAISHQPHSSPVVISAVAGAAGVGKTALAVHWAHRVRRAFPDGDLYVDLRGYGLHARLTAEQALSGFLHALNVPAARIPADLGARSALFRSVLDGRRVLVLLDNAATPDQVRHLLPGTGRCLVLVTSRNRLSGLIARDGASRMTVDHLTQEESLNLLSEIVGADRVDAEPEAARHLAALCDHLPLALRIVAERAVTHPHHDLSDLVGELLDERDRLDGLALDEDELSTVRTVFSWSYRSLAPDTARTFRLLGLHPSPELATSAVVALTGVPRVRAARALDSLSGLHLVQQTKRDRYRVHDLIRSYALERAMEEETEVTRGEAVDRTLGWYLHTAHAASRLILPQMRHLALPPMARSAGGETFGSLDEALHWCETERMALLDAVREARSSGRNEIAWKLPIALMGFFERRSYWDDWIATHRTGLEAARSLGDRFGEGWVALSLADAYWDLRRFDDALECYSRALAATRETADRWGEGFSLRGMSLSFLERGEFQQAINYSRLALPIFAEIGERRGEGMCHLSIGQGHLGLGHLDDATSCMERALAIFRELGNEWSQALATFRLGTALHRRDDSAAAIGRHTAAATAFRRLGDRRHEAMVLDSLGDIHRAAGDIPQATDAWRRSLTLFEELEDPKADTVRSKLAD
ncbi:ATP-binding protein [Streptomyces sp. 6N223]|uniref:ATP-binding protein n=1 Tax=Streptomyces sp. 6N223 TaxID=3457412 RepID=UPI003FD54C63